MFTRVFGHKAGQNSVSSRLVAGFLGLALLAVPTSAFATIANSSAVGTAHIVEYQPGVLLIQTPDGNNYSAQLTGSAGCPNQVLDSLKAWQSLAQASLLSGKSLKIYFCTDTAAPGAHFITAIDLDQ